MLNLETAVGSQKSAQVLGAPGKIQKCLITTVVTTTFCISPCTPISYTAVLRPTAVARLKNGVSLRQGYGRQASGVLGPLSGSRTRVRSSRQAYSAEVATKAGSACGLAERAF